MSGGGLHITSRDASMDASVCRGISPWVVFISLVSISPCIGQDQSPQGDRPPSRSQGQGVSASSTLQTLAHWCSRWIVHGPLMSIHPSLSVPSSDLSPDSHPTSSGSPTSSDASEECVDEQPILELPIAPPVPPSYQLTRRPRIHLVHQPGNCG